MCLDSFCANTEQLNLYFFRNEKIRTYNFSQDRVTDHRVKLTVNGIKKFMDGSKEFEEFLNDLISIDRQEQLNRFLDNQEAK